MPLALVTTAVPLMVVIPRAFPLALEAGAELAGLLAPAAGVDEAELLAELPHAERARARAASPAAPSIFRIRFLPFYRVVAGDRAAAGPALSAPPPRLPSGYVR